MYPKSVLKGDDNIKAAYIAIQSINYLGHLFSIIAVVRLRTANIGM